MSSITFIQHKKGSPGFRHFGLGPKLHPCRGMQQLITLFNENTFWAKSRNLIDIQRMLKQSDVVVTVWSHKKLIGFGRSLTDSIYRAVLWDVIIASEYKGRGYGRLLIEKIIKSKELMNVEKIYIMTTNHKEFYKKNGFQDSYPQILLYKTLE